jgi:hypothetical protein
MSDQALDQADAEIRVRSLAAMPEEIEVLDDLILLMHRGTALLSGIKHDRGLNLLAGILVGRAFNSLWRSREDLLSGYPVQSLMLCRAALEDWATLIWLELHPEKVNLCLWAIYPEVKRPAGYPPKFEAIWKELGDLGEIPRVMYDTLSKFAHPKGIGLRWLVEFDEQNTTFHYGPQFDQDRLKIVLFNLIPVAQAFGERIARLQDRMLGEPDQEWLDRGKACSAHAIRIIDRMYEDFAAN